jgi:hypothetical protein
MSRDGAEMLLLQSPLLLAFASHEGFELELRDPVGPRVCDILNGL